MLTKAQVAEKIIDRNQDKWMTITFTKKDGTTRKINGRVGVHRYVKGTTNRATPSGTVVVWSPAITGYRCIRLDSIKSIKSRNYNYNVSIFED